MSKVATFDVEPLEALREEEGPDKEKMFDFPRWLRREVDQDPAVAAIRRCDMPVGAGGSLRAVVPGVGVGRRLVEYAKREKASPVVSERASSQRVLRHRDLHVLRRSQPAALPRHLRRVEALIRIDDGIVIRGELPGTAARLVEQWRQLHQGELTANWELAQQPSALTSIEPLQ